MSDDRLPTGNAHAIREVVREKYGAIAVSSGSCCGPSGGCGSTSAEAVLDQIGYTAEQAAAIPEGANLGLGCGNPLAFAAVKAGETVLDLGSGAGIDAFLAARETGPTGHVIGVDMTTTMLQKARSAAEKHGYKNVEFRLGEIEHLPVADASVDVIISNCVVNLSPDKPQVFREAFRVLKPGGRLMVSDLVLVRPLTPTVRDSIEAYVGCVAGASSREDYLQHVRAAGFVKIEVVEQNPYTVGADSASGEFRDGLSAVASAKVRAVKP